MRNGLIFTALLVAGAYCASGYELREVRSLYYSANDSKRNSELFYKMMKDVNAGHNATLIGYKGMAYIMSCKHSNNPYTKLSYFNQGKNLLEKALKNAPDNVEVHFLRFCVQSQVPQILMYSSNLAADKHIILSNWQKIADADLKHRIKTYMLEYGNCTVTEKQYLQ